MKFEKVSESKLVEMEDGTVTWFLAVLAFLKGLSARSAQAGPADPQALANPAIKQ